MVYITKTITKTGTDAVGLDHNPIITYTTAKVTMIPTKAIPGHTTGTTDDITGVIHGAQTQVLIHIILAMTLHTTDHLHIGATKIAPCQSSSQFRRPQGKSHTNTINDVDAVQEVSWKKI